MSDFNSSQPNHDAQKFMHLLPFYVTRQVSEDEAAFVENYLAQTPGALAALQFTDQLRLQVRSIGADRRHEPGLAYVLANLSPQARQTLHRRLLARWRNTGKGWRILIALIAAALMGLGTSDAWLQPLIDALGELGIADALLILI